MSDVPGQRIVSLHLGPWDESPGMEMPGIAGPTWYYADAFVALDSGAVLCLTPVKVTIVSAIPADAKVVELQDDTGMGCIGGQVEDLLEVDPETVVVLLDDGRHLANSLVPGGTSFRIGRFDAWGPDELKTEAKSVLTGMSRDLAGYLRRR